MPTIREVKTELRHREWAEQIQECQSSVRLKSNVFLIFY